MDQEWHTLRKISLENGGEGDLIEEGLAWILMARAGAITRNGTWVKVHVNGSFVGVYTRVEQVDKAFLRHHLNEDEWFLYKELEQRTRELESDPFASALCYTPFDNDCSLPPDGYDSLHLDLDVPVLFRKAAVNAFMVNSDSLLSKPNNNFWYSSPLPRRYFAWDLDSVLVQPGNSAQTDPHNFGAGQKLWQTTLLGDPECLEWPNELDR